MVGKSTHHSRGSNGQKREFSVSIAVVLGGLMALVLLFSLGVWISTFVVGNTAIEDLNVMVRDETSRNAKSRIIALLSEQQRATANIANQLPTMMSMTGGTNNFDIINNATMVQHHMASFLNPESSLSALAIFDPSTGALVGSFNSQAGVAVANYSGQYQPDSCAQSGAWSSVVTGSGAVNLLVVSTQGSFGNATIVDFKFNETAGIPTSGFGSWPSRWAGLSRSQIAFGMATTLPNGVPVAVYSTVSTTLVRDVLTDLEAPGTELEAFVVDTSVVSNPMVFASRNFNTELCSGVSFVDDCSATACSDTARSFTAPSVYHNSINSHVTSSYGSWSSSSSSSFGVGSARQTLSHLVLPQGHDYGLRWALVVSVGDGQTADNLRESQNAIIVAFALSAVIQIGIIIIITLLIRSPLNKLRADIDKAGQLDLATEAQQLEMQADRIGGFQILADHYNNVGNSDEGVSYDGDEDDEASHKGSTVIVNKQKKDASSSVFSEVASLEKGFREMQTTIRSFSFYVPQDVVSRLIRKGELATLSMTYKYISLMFIDVESFTEMCEKIRERRLVKILEIYFGICGECIGDSGGTVDKYIGDAVMAIWGAPTTVDNMNARACMAALMIQNQIRDPATQEIMGDLDFKIRIGIHGGRALCGNVGCRKRMNFTALGDSVNLAARLETLNKEYGTRIMISSQVARDVAGMCVTRQLGKVTVKGKSIATDVFELVGVNPDSRPLFEGVEGIVGDPPTPRMAAGNASIGGSTYREEVARSHGRSSQRSSVYGSRHETGDSTNGSEGKSTIGATGDRGEETFTIEELLELCRQEIEVDEKTLDFCTMYSHAVQQYLRGEFVGSLETFLKCKKHLADDYSKDAMFRKKQMDNMIKEMENIMNSGFAGGMTTGQAAREEKSFARRPSATAAAAGASLGSHPGMGANRSNRSHSFDRGSSYNSEDPMESHPASVPMPIMA